MADLKTTNIYGDAYINNKVGINTNTPATRLQIGQLSPTAATEGIQFGDDTSTRIYRGAAGQINFNGTINVLGNTYLGDANGDTVFVNDTIRIGATDSGDASLFFGEGGIAGSDYGARWYWDSGYTFTWYTRNAGTDTALFDYVTNDLNYINWRRHFHMQNKEINYNAQVHFNAGTRFVGSNTSYLIFRSDSGTAGGIQVQDGSATTKGYTGYWDAAGGGILNNTGNWAVRYNFGNANSGGTLYGAWTVNGNISATNLSGTNTGDQTVGNGTITIAAGTGISVASNTFTTNQTGNSTVTVTNSSPNATHTGDVTGATALTIANDAVTTVKILNANVTNAKLANSSLTIGSTAISLGATATTIAGLTSVTSTTFVGALTGNASTATSADNIDGRPFVNTNSNSATNADSINSNGISYYTGGVTNFSGNATDGGLYSQAYSNDWQHQIAGDYRSGQIALRGKNSGTWQSWRRVLDDTNSPYALNMNQYVRTTDSPTFAGLSLTSVSTTGATITNLTGAYQNTTVYDSPKTQSATPSRGIRAPASSIQFTDSYAIAPFWTYRSTGDWPVPYGIGWGTGGESSGIFQRYASNGSSFGDMIFYTGNDGSGAFSFRRHTWEGTTHFAAGSGELNTELFRIDWAGKATATSFALPGGFTITDPGSGYAAFSNWVLLGTTGFYSSTNSAHLLPNPGSYGSWKITGTRGGWYGIEFDSGVSLMANSSEVGFHRNGHGWQMWWSGGTGYVHKGNPGGGTQATILDSSNYTSYSPGLGTNNTLTGINVINNTSNTLINNQSGNLGLTMFQATAGTDAYMTFHIGSDYAAYLGLGGAENDLVYGGWSAGNNRHRILHSGNAAYAWNMNQYVRTTDSPTFNTVTANITGNAYNNLANDYKDIYVYGDVNTYYVVLIQGEYLYSFGRYSVTRGYNWTGPDTWNVATHKGGLTLDWEWSGDTAWGGNDKAIRIIEFNESYSTMVAGLGYPVNGGVIIWLRGGGVNGAQYRIRTPNGSNSVVTVYDGLSIANHVASTTFTAADSTVFSSRANTNNVSAEILARYPVRATGGLFDGNNAVLHAGNYNSYSPTLTGTGASGNWAINVTGNAATATTLQTARAINGVSFNGSAAITVNGLNYNVNNDWLRENGDDDQFKLYGNSRTMIYRTDGNTNAHGGGAFAHIFYYGGSADANRMFIINTDGRLWSPYHGWLDTMSISGNAATATTLQTARNINGTSFNGSAAITTATWGTARTITIGSTGKSVDGSANVSWTLAEIGAAATNQTMFIGTTSVAINRASAAISLAGTSIDGTAGGLNSSNYISRIGSSGNYNTDFQNTPAGTVRHQGDDANITNTPGGTWWFVDNYRHSNASNYWGTQVAWGWEDNANKLATRNITGNSFGSWVYYLNSVNYTDYTVTKTGTGASGTWGINITGNAATATTATNVTIANGSVTLAKIENITAYTILGNSNASAAATPAALSVATVATMLSGQTMNINGSSTSCSGTAANATTAGGLAVHTGTNNEANKIVRTQGNGYIMAGWINTISGDNGTTAIDRVYASSDGYIRYYTPANFRTVLDVPTRAGSGASGNWAINITGNAATATTATTAGALTTGNTYTIAGLTSNGTINIFPTYADSYSYFLRMGYDNSGNYDYTVKRNGTTGFLEFNGTQTNYVAYYFAVSGASGIGIGVSPAARLHINGDGTNPPIRIDNPALGSGASNSRSFHGWLPISIGGTTKYIQLYN